MRRPTREDIFAMFGVPLPLNTNKNKPESKSDMKKQQPKPRKTYISFQRDPRFGNVDFRGFGFEGLSD